MGEDKWAGRWKKLHDAGLTFEQAEIVFQVLSEARAFLYAWLEDVAWEKLRKEYGRGED